MPPSPLAVGLVSCAGLVAYHFLKRRQAGRLPPTGPGQSDAVWIEKCRDLVATCERPHHSNFLVAAVLVYVDDTGATRFTTGVNSEVCSITGCICAERTAALQLRLSPVRVSRIEAVYITATASEIITPGLLCREFLSEIGQPGTRVIMFTPDWQPSDGLGSAPQGQFVSSTLGDLYAYPCLYRGVQRAQLLTTAESFAAKAAKLDFAAARTLFSQEPQAASTGSALAQLSAATFAALPGLLSPGAAAATGIDAAVVKLYKRVVDAASAAGPVPAQDTLYPIHYAAGVLFAQGGMAVARQDLCLEYGCSADAVHKLAHTIQLASSSAQGAPTVLLMADQYGILHAPFAAARAWLAEYGYGSTLILLHDQDTGLIRKVAALDLSPAAPAISL